MRQTLCTQCDGLLEIAEEAKSVACPHCSRRVVTEALDVKEYVAVRRFATANRMRIGKKAIVYASVRADDLVVEGVLQGDATSLGPIRIAKGARVAADLRAARLTVEPGALVVGQMHIGPDQVPETDPARLPPDPPEE